MKPRAELAFDIVLKSVQIGYMVYKGNSSAMRSMSYVLIKPVVLRSGTEVSDFTQDFIYAVTPGLLDFVKRGFDGKDILTLIPSVEFVPRLLRLSTRGTDFIHQSLLLHLSDTSLRGI